MSVIKITVDDQNLHIIDSPKIAAQGVNENYVEFTFSDDWDGFGKTAIFYNESDPETVYTSLVDGNGLALIPHEITESEGRISLGLSGVKDNIVKTSEILTYKIVKGLYVAESSEPSPGIYEQMLTIVGGIQSDQAAFKSEIEASIAEIESETSSSIAVIDARVDNLLDESRPGSVTTLWTGSINKSGESATLSENVSAFDFLDFYLLNGADTKFIRVPASQASIEIQAQNMSDDGSNPFLYLWETGIAISGTTVTVNKCVLWCWINPGTDSPTVTNNAQNGPAITRIDGVLMSDESPAELLDIRVGADGTTYASAGAAVRGQISDLDERTFARIGDNIINPNDIEGKGVWWYNGIRHTTGTATTDTYTSVKIYVKPDTLYHFRTYRTSDNIRTNYGYIYFNPFKSDGTFISGVTGSNDFTTGTDWAYVIITYKAFENDTLTYKPMCSENALPDVFEDYAILTGSYIIEKFDEIDKQFNKRKVMYISSDDDDTQLLLKMLEAYNHGNMDIFFEKATYTLHDAYDYMRNTLGWTWAIGLPIGNNCRYYFNGSTIISNAPSDNYSDSRNILDSMTTGSNYEIHDVTLINNGGRYCVHDEGYNSKTPYFHRYDNVTMIYNKTDLTPDTGAKAFGGGAGFDTTLIFEGCVFIHNEQDITPVAIHAPTSNPNDEPCKLYLAMRNSYMNRANIYINVYDADRDTVDFVLFGNKTVTAFTDPIVNLIENNNTLIS